MTFCERRRVDSFPGKTIFYKNRFSRTLSKKIFIRKAFFGTECHKNAFRYAFNSSETVGTSGVASISR
jgi:hypothetical protein